MKALAHFATLLLLFPFLIWQFLVFDRLLRLEYERFRAAWEHDGCPPGFFWSPPRSDRDTAPTLSRPPSWIRQEGIRQMRYMARGTVAAMWLVVTPPWMQQDQNALALVSKLRRLWLGFIFIGIPALALANLAIVALTDR